MTDEPKGPAKINVEEILSEDDASVDGGPEIDDLEVVGMEPPVAAPVAAPLPQPGPARSQTENLELAELEERHLRLRADFDNYRKRVDRTKAEFGRRAAAAQVRKLLPVVDNLERALGESPGEEEDAFREGVALIYRQMMDVLEQEGLKRVDAVGYPFDPGCHDAVERRATNDFPDQTVMEELQKGYWFQGKLLRPAMVRVAFRPQTEGQDETPGD